MIEAKGFDGRVSFDGTWAVIARSGFNARMQHHGAGETRIHISDLTGLDYRPNSMITGTRGHLTLLVGGTIPGKRGSLKRLKDDMSVSFTLNGKDFEAVRDAIYLAMDQWRRSGLIGESPSALAGESTQAPPPPPDAPEANWYPDPTGRARLRYWDGTAWSEHTAP